MLFEHNGQVSSGIILILGRSFYGLPTVPPRDLVNHREQLCFIIAKVRNKGLCVLVSSYVAVHRNVIPPPFTGTLSRFTLLPVLRIIFSTHTSTRIGPL